MGHTSVIQGHVPGDREYVPHAPGTWILRGERSPTSLFLEAQRNTLGKQPPQNWDVSMLPVSVYQSPFFKPTSLLITRNIKFLKDRKGKVEKSPLYQTSYTTSRIPHPIQNSRDLSVFRVPVFGQIAAFPLVLISIIYESMGFTFNQQHPTLYVPQCLCADCWIPLSWFWQKGTMENIFCR